jgi:hypothetical protein
MVDEKTQPGPAKQEYHTTGGLSSYFMQGEGNAPDEEVLHVPAPEQEQQETPLESAPPQEAVPQPEPQGEVIEYNKPDGTQGTIELSNDPAERKKQIASAFSGKDAYLLNKEIVKQQDPELAGKMYQMMQNQTDILGKLTEQQEQTQKQADPLSVLTDDQARYYNHLKEQGDDTGAESYFKSQYATNMMIYDQQQKLEKMEKSQIQQSNQTLVERNVNKFRQLDPSLPNPGYTPEQGQVFLNEFYKGYGGFLRGTMRYTDQQIMFGDLDHDYLYKQYQANSATANTTQAAVPPGATPPAATANQTVSPEVLQTMQDVSGGAAQAPMGNEPDESAWMRGANQRDLRVRDRKDGSISENFIKSLGGDVVNYIQRKRDSQKK